jgi:penicillin-binding protein 2
MNGNPNIRNNIEAWRVNIFTGIVAVTFVIYLVRLFVYQIVEGTEWVALAEGNRVTEISLQTDRGIIYDRNGFVLAKNIAAFNLIITPALLPEDDGSMQEIFRQVSRMTGMPIHRGQVTQEDPYVPCRSDHGITQIVDFGRSFAPYRPVRILCDLERSQAMILQEMAVDWPGVEIEVESVRDYPTGSLTSTVIGFLGPISELEEQYYRDRGFLPERDKVGYAGVERFFQSILAGRNGRRVVEIDVAGKIIRDLEPPVPSAPGFNLHLTLDTRLQSAAEAVLTSTIDYWNLRLGEIRSTSGVVIAINPKTGEILAMVSYPSYENNRMARFIPEYYYTQLSEDQTNPLMNHAVADRLPAGSVFKLVTAIGVLNEGVITPERILDAPPLITITERYFANDPGKAREFVDWNRNTGGFGRIDFVNAVGKSSNVYFYKVGGGYGDEVTEGLGICRLGTYARALGYGSYPRIEFPLVENGLVPDPTWKRLNLGENWSTGDTYLASVGQGYIIATPLQVLLSAAIIANDGVYMKPTILREIVDDEGNVIKSFLPEVVWDVTQDALIDEIAEPNTPGGCENKITGEKKVIEPWVVQKVQEGMRLAVIDGTLDNRLPASLTIPAAGKTGTAEYCDKFALEKNLCEFGNWPTHAWTVGYAPYDDPEIAVVAFVYNGGEGSPVAGPMVGRVLAAYFELKAADTTLGNP